MERHHLAQLLVLLGELAAALVNDLEHAEHVWRVHGVTRVLLFFHGGGGGGKRTLKRTLKRMGVGV